MFRCQGMHTHILPIHSEYLLAENWLSKDVQCFKNNIRVPLSSLSGVPYYYSPTIMNIDSRRAVCVGPGLSYRFGVEFYCKECSSSLEVQRLT